MKIALQGDFGRPRSALVIQSDKFIETATVTVLLVSSTLVDAPLMRITVEPNELNNLKKTSQIMIDKAMTVRKEKLGAVFGIAGDKIMLEVGRCLAVFWGIAT